MICRALFEEVQVSVQIASVELLMCVCVCACLYPCFSLATGLSADHLQKASQLRLLSTLLMVMTMRTHWSGLRHRPHGTAAAVVTSFLQIAAVWETLGARHGEGIMLS